MNKTIPALAMALILLAGCNKDDGGTTPSATDKITKGLWLPRQGGEDLNKNGILESAEQEPMADCEKDDTYEFKADKSLVVNDNAKKCDPGDPGTTVLTWSLANGDTEINFGVPGSPIAFNFKIQELTDNLMRLSYTDDGDQYIIIYGR
jgi:hypothetical protein